MAMKSLIGLLSLMPITTILALNPNCNPGGNFDLSYWDLLLPAGNSDIVDIIKSKYLQGCRGYTGIDFFTDSTTGELVLTTGCATTETTLCRTELREIQKSSGQIAAWSPKGTNTLAVQMKVVESDNSSRGIAIGQVVVAATSIPLAEIYYSQKGDIVAGVKPKSDGSQVITKLDNVPVGHYFTFVLSYSNNTLNIIINDKKTSLSTYDWNSPASYFKTGNNNQATSYAATEVHIQSIAVKHS